MLVFYLALTPKNYLAFTMPLSDSIYVILLLTVY